MVSDEHIKERILAAASELFRRHGVRAVSMDDLARELGMSKKTIYQQVASKSELVRLFLLNHFERNADRIRQIKADARDPVETAVHIAKLTAKHHQVIYPELLHDIKKSYFDLWKLVQEKGREMMSTGLEANLRAGMKSGVYRADIKPGYIAELFSHLVQMEVLIKYSRLDPGMTFLQTLDYHMYGILTAKGRRLYQKYRKILLT